MPISAVPAVIIATPAHLAGVTLSPSTKNASIVVTI